MCESTKKCLFGALAIVVVLLVEDCHLITTGGPNGTAEEILWNLTMQAVYNTQIEGRQRGTGFMYPQQHFGLYRPTQQQYGPQPPYTNPTENIMDVLSTVAGNDDLQCVPKLLCELTSGSTQGYNRDSSSSSFLPFKINMDSLLGLLSSLPIGGSSPLVLFGRAALLGYTSKSPSSCYYSFPRCPTDPDKLVNYLNNYNGGFFRYFSGRPRPQGGNPQFGNYYGAQQRILSKPAQLVATSSGGRPVTFPGEGGGFYVYKSGKSLAFPQEGRYGLKMVTFPVGNAINKLEYQRPLPNHVASPNIFPTRTGTGELILDTDDFDSDYRKNRYIRFN